ncbi:MAG TPA: hypothetical protein VEC38_12090 [Candidatus Binataceae bacterium]|nr:hypothetical protein [Candidatus Binataceae bacterium]
MNNAAQATIKYGYDCDDELIGMSNNGTAIQSCGPTTQVLGSGNTSTQVALNYDSDGNFTSTIVDGVETDFTYDGGERLTSQTFRPFATTTPTPVPYGTLTYQYDYDSRLRDKGGTLAAINFPSADTATYSATDQMATFNGNSTSPDNASNITYDPANSETLTWSARNQLLTFSSGPGETYDAIGRRDRSTIPGSDSLAFLHDGSSVLGWLDSTGNYWNFLSLPGGGAVAGSYTASGATTTLVPLIDGSGSTIGLVNAAQVNSGPVTTYTYDPSGKFTVNGTQTSWPFLAGGGEHEFTDPASLYYSGSGRFYDPQIQRSLSQMGATGLSQPSLGGAGGGGGGGGGGSGGGGPNVFLNLAEGGAIGTGVGLAATAAVGFASGGIAGAEAAMSELWAEIVGGSAAADPAIAPFVAAVAIVVDFLYNLFEDLFGGGKPEVPRQLLHKRHPLYPVILGISDGIIVTEGSPSPANDDSDRPLQINPYFIPVQFPGYNACGPGNNGKPTQPGTTDNCCNIHDQCYASAGLTWLDAIEHLGGLGAGKAQAACDRALCKCVGDLETSPSSQYDYRMRISIENTFCY